MGTGPPPDPPRSIAEAEVDERVARRRKQSVLLAKARDIRSAAAEAKSRTKKGVGGGVRPRFWKDVSVQEIDGAYQIHLDARALRHPTTKSILRLPLSKPALAHALAVEWDHLPSASAAARPHLVPLTSLVCRANDIATDDERGATTRTEIATSLLPYLDTDSLLCWSPPEQGEDGDELSSLRALQQRTASFVLEHLTMHTWPGVQIRPALDPGSIVLRPQEPGTRAVVQGWVTGLSPWELAGLERAVLACKGLLGAARLVVEWSEGGAGARGEYAFGVDEAARAASLEVDWQTGRWGEVEDTHDVNREDLRRQLGSVVLLVSGTGGER